MERMRNSLEAQGRRSRHAGHSALLALSLSSLLLLSACGTSAGAEEPSVTPTTQNDATGVVAAEATEAQPTPAQEQLRPAEIAERMVASTVLIRADFPETAFSEEGTGSCTGIVLNDEGKILTNAHCVQGAAVVRVTTSGSSKFRAARIEGISSCDDVAVLHVDNTEGLVPATFGSSGDLVIGDEVYALGFPLGDEELSIVSGIVSKLDVVLGAFESLIQTDAAINPGNSGGPLVNQYGEVIGVNTLRISRDDVSGINFAISIDQAQAIAPELQEGTNRLWHGMNLRPFDLDNGQQVLVVDAVESGSPAAGIGVQAGDLLTNLEGIEVTSRAQVCEVLRSRNSGDSVKLNLLRFSETEIQALEGVVVIDTPGEGEDLVVTNSQPREQQGASNGDQAVAEGAQSPPAVDSLVRSDDEVLAARAAYDARAARSEVLLFETFDRGNVTRASWPENQTALLRNSLYEIVLEQPNQPQVLILQPRGEPLLMSGDYIVQLDVALHQGAGTAAGIVFNGQGDGDGSVFLVRGDGNWQLLTFRNAGVDRAFSTNPVPTTAIRGGGQVNQVRVERTGDAVQLWINHTPVASVGGYPFASGQVGVAAMATEMLAAPASVLTDNFQLLAGS